jgi:AbrB family looped-hinge helix DNA binding protein
MTETRRVSMRVSTKGQVVLPKSIRQQRRWAPGTRLLVAGTPDRVLLKPAPLFAPTRPEDVLGSLSSNGPPRSREGMDASVLDGRVAVMVCCDTQKPKNRRSRARLIAS